MSLYPPNVFNQLTESCFIAICPAIPDLISSIAVHCADTNTFTQGVGVSRQVYIATQVTYLRQAMALNVS